MPTEAELEALGAYVTNRLAAVAVMKQEQRYLTEIAEGSLGSAAERYAAAGAAAAIGGQLIELKSAHDAYLSRLSISIKAPSVEVVKRSAELATELAQVIRATVKASIVLDVVTKFVADWTALIAAPSPATAPAP
jgi:hypothetical protein